MLFPKSLSIGTACLSSGRRRFPPWARIHFQLLGVALGPPSGSCAADLGAVLIFLFIAFVPMGPRDLVATSEDGGHQRARAARLFLFGIAPRRYFAGFTLILRHLRATPRHSLRIGDPFQPANVSR